MTTKSGNGSQGIMGIERALDVLSLYLEDDAAHLGITDIASRVGLSKAVVHRILTSFKSRGFVDVDPTTRQYRLSPRLLEFGLAYLNRLDRDDIARDALKDLSARTDETATLSVRSGWRRVYVAQVTPPRDIKMVVELGASFPLHAGGSSKAFLAFMPDELQSAYLDGPDELDRFTERTIIDKAAVRRDLAEIRERGYAISLGERQAGAGSVAAPVLDYTGSPVHVISVCGPLDRFESEIDSCAKALLESVAELSRKLGHVPDR